MINLKSLNKAFREGNQSGMSLVELVISIALLSLFVITYSGFVRISSKFYTKEVKDLAHTNGLLIDHHYLFLTLEKYSSFLSQPGITLTDINNIKKIKVGNLPSGCSFSPQIEWDLPIDQKPILELDWQPSNAGYAICLKSTSVTESSLSDLVSKSKGNSLDAQPGLYFLIALPDKVSINGLPVRKLFCRPKTFC